MLELADLHTYYGNIRALRGLSLSVERGEIVTLIGGNGAGKTTTLRTILGLVRPRRGSVFFFQAEDGIRDHCVTGVQTCALPICAALIPPKRPTNLRAVG